MKSFWKKDKIFLSPTLYSLRNNIFKLEQCTKSRDFCCCVIWQIKLFTQNIYHPPAKWFSPFCRFCTQKTNSHIDKWKLDGKKNERIIFTVETSLKLVSLIEFELNLENSWWRLKSMFDRRIEMVSHSQHTYVDFYGTNQQQHTSIDLQLFAILSCSHIFAALSSEQLTNVIVCKSS